MDLIIIKYIHNYIMHIIILSKLAKNPGLPVEGTSLFLRHYATNKFKIYESLISLSTV